MHERGHRVLVHVATGLNKAPPVLHTHIRKWVNDSRYPIHKIEFVYICFVVPRACITVEAPVLRAWDFTTASTSPLNGHPSKCYLTVKLLNNSALKGTGVSNLVYPELFLVLSRTGSFFSLWIRIRICISTNDSQHIKWLINVAEFIYSNSLVNAIWSWLNGGCTLMPDRVVGGQRIGFSSCFHLGPESSV